MIEITSVEQLHKWNQNPTSENPVLLEWLLNWIFDDCLRIRDFNLYKEAYMEFVKFTQIREKMSKPEAILRVNNNLDYWRRRASKNEEPFKKYTNKILIKELGV